MREYRYTTPHGIDVTRIVSQVVYRRGLAHLARELDRHRGIYLASGYEYPGRYSRWDIGSTCPPLEIVSYDRRVEFRPLNERGRKILQMFHPVLAGHPHWDEFGFESDMLAGRLKPMPALFPEEERSRQPSVFSVLRALIEEFREEKDSHLGLVGAFGYDLLFQFEPIVKRLPRSGHKDLHLFLCDDIFFSDRKKEQIDHYQYDFEREGVSTRGLPRDAEEVAPPPQRAPGPIVSDHTPQEYMAGVEKVRQGMARGDYYEVVLRQTFRAPYSGKPSELFERVQDANPSPYEFFLQFGDEQLIGASPEMFVRVEESRVETCPIAGTAQRTGDPLRDAENIAELIGSLKEESELTLCTDVDRNDKSRVCKPGTVKVIERRLIEKYAGVFHTVDHVEGILRDDLDSLDAFLSHMWAVTLIGAPKKAAAQAIETLEKDARGWYGGAIGMLLLNGGINTGILIRTTYLRDGMASYPVGATLLYDSVPAMEERETRLKATGFFRILGAPDPVPPPVVVERGLAGQGARLLLVDNDDCFIQTIANWRRSGHLPRRLFSRPDCPTGAQPDPDFTRTGPSRGFRRTRPGKDRGTPGPPGIRRVPGLAGHSRGLRRRPGRARLSDARQAFHGAPPRSRCLRRTARGIPGGPLPFLIRAPGDAPRVSRSDRGDHRWRHHHGSAAQGTAHRSRPVSPRIYPDADAWSELRATAH
jgi:anthranilate synthase